MIIVQEEIKSIQPHITPEEMKSLYPQSLYKKGHNFESRPAECHTSILDDKKGYIFQLFNKIDIAGKGIIIYVVHFFDLHVEILKAFTYLTANTEQIKNAEDEFSIAHELGSVCQNVAKGIKIAKSVEDDIAYIEMLIEWGGIPLDQYEEKRPADVIEWAKQSIKAMYIIGEKHAVFPSDLNPQNMVAYKSMLKIIDYGGAIDMGTHSKNVHETVKKPGTIREMIVEYSPPEILNDEKSLIRPAIDVYCWGMTFYSLMSGKCPRILREENMKFKVGKNEKIYEEFLVMVTETRMKGEKVDQVNNKLLPWIIKCLAWDPKRRPSFAELLKEVEKDLK